MAGNAAEVQRTIAKRPLRRTCGRQGDDTKTEHTERRDARICLGFIAAAGVAACVCRKSDSAILMVKAAKDRS